MGRKVWIYKDAGKWCGELSNSSETHLSLSLWEDDSRERTELDSMLRMADTIPKLYSFNALYRN